MILSGTVQQHLFTLSYPSFKFNVIFSEKRHLWTPTGGYVTDYGCLVLHSHGDEFNLNSTSKEKTNHPVLTTATSTACL